MLRYSNVCVRGVGAQSAMGMRIRPGMMFPAARIRGGGVLGRSILLSGSQQHQALSATWIRAIAARGLATESDATEREEQKAATKRWEDLVSRNRQKKDMLDKADPEEAALLLDIAAAATAPKYTGKDKRAPQVSSTAVQMELKWLQDPRKLADRVAELLRKRRAPMAVALIRQAQKQHMECGVAWNNLLEYCMNKGAPMAAFKFYNEVRGRPVL